ncbi:hypothetical protein [Sphingobium sp. HWE2-09]|uniref:hypothetical protein n=1 Tax=Sphingobium sp. HWE2-09 TaxID=3108390 RepID=UPI002DD18C19|nr:hypothetical protein [Sphingobium sp. HWE2-09]
MTAYKELFRILNVYWSDYGRYREVSKSPFFHLALILSFLNLIGILSISWREMAKSTLPTMMGFSLAAYTIAFSLMGSDLHTALKSAINQRRGVSLLKMVNVTFFHIVFVQTAGYLYSISTEGSFFWRILGKSTDLESINGIILMVIILADKFIGSLFLFYGSILLLSIAIAMFRLGRLSALTNITRPPNDDG